jgi:hypothetical protein
MASITQVDIEFYKKSRHLELISKLWIAFDGKTPADEKAQSRRVGMSILKRIAKPSLGGR